MLKALAARIRGSRRMGSSARNSIRKGDRVVIATRLYAPEPTPAAFRHEALVDELRRRQVRVRVLTTSLPKSVRTTPDRDVSRWPVIRDAQGHVKGYVSYMSFDIPLIFRLLFVRSPRVIIAEPPPTTGFAVLLASKLRRVPYVYYAADVWADASRTVEGVPGVVPTVLGFFERLVWREASLILAISPGVQERIEELIGDAAPIAMVGNGIRVHDFSIKGTRRSEAAAPYFVYAGTVSEWHGAGIFVEAFARVAAEFPDARLVFFSEGAEKASLEEQAERLGLHGIEFHSRVSSAVLSEHLRRADVSLASVRPGKGYDFAIPTKIYASTASGTPVIYAGEGPSVPMVRENDLGWAVDYSVETVVTAMTEAIEASRSGQGPSPYALRAWSEAHASLEARAATIVDAMDAHQL